MDNSGEIKIRALPRGTEDDQKKTAPQDKSKESKPKRWIVYVGVSVAVLCCFAFYAQMSRKSKGEQVAQAARAKAVHKAELASTAARINDNVSRHMQDAEIQARIMKRTREMENAPFRASLVGLDEQERLNLPDENVGNFGVQLDTEGSAEKVFEDLNVNGGSGYSADMMPADKINARIANRKWMNEVERQEKINFISNFIRTAYAKGYEVEIDQNLVVVGVKKINKNKMLDINQVIDRLAKGQQPGGAG